MTVKLKGPNDNHSYADYCRNEHAGENSVLAGFKFDNNYVATLIFQQDWNTVAEWLEGNSIEDGLRKQAVAITNLLARLDVSRVEKCEILGVVREE